MKNLKDNPELTFDAMKDLVVAEWFGINEFIVKENSINDSRAHELRIYMQNSLSQKLSFRILYSDYLDDREWIFNGYYSKGDNTQS